MLGNRAPFLQGGGDNMYEMLSENNFDYDCSWQEHMDTLMQRMDSIPTR